MKKTIIATVMIGILLCSFLLVSCDKNDTCAVTFVLVEENGTTSQKTISVDIGSTINTSIYLNTIEKSDTQNWGAPNYYGLYYDKECIFKRNDDKSVEGNETVYIKAVYRTNQLTFVMGDNTYSIPVDPTQEISVFDFITCAYGKSCRPEEFDFFTDEAMENPITLDGYSYKTAERQVFLGYVIYVKQYEMLNVNFNVEDKETHFHAYVRKNSPLNAEIYQQLYSAYFNEEAVPSLSLKFYADSNNTTELTAFSTSTVYVCED